MNCAVLEPGYPSCLIFYVSHDIFFVLFSIELYWVNVTIKIKKELKMTDFLYFTKIVEL